MEQYRMEEISCIEGMNARILLQNFAQGEGSVTLHWHKNIEINLILKGSAKFIIDGKEYNLKAGEFCVINSGVIHAGAPGLSDNSSGMELITILWEYDFFETYCKDFYKYRFDIDMINPAAKEIRDKIIEIGILYRAKSSFYEMKISAQLLLVGVILLREFLCEEKNNLEYKRLKNVNLIQSSVEYIEKYYFEKLSLEDIAKTVNMAPTYFSKVFKKMTGINFYEFVILCRIRHAREDLMNTDMSMTDITYDFPPTFVMTSEEDFLREEGSELVQTLSEQKVSIMYRLYKSEQKKLGHVFHCDVKSEEAYRCNKDECEFFKSFILN